LREKARGGKEHMEGAEGRKFFKDRGGGRGAK